MGCSSSGANVPANQSRFTRRGKSSRGFPRAGKIPRVLEDNSNLFERLSVHQDLPWFVALLGWSLALVIWRWHPQRSTAWRWLPWVAGACLVAALVQFAIFSPPFSAFYERTQPV